MRQMEEIVAILYLKTTPIELTLLQKWTLYIYKASVLPIVTYALETGTETSETRQMLKAIEMKILRKIVG